MTTEGPRYPAVQAMLQSTTSTGPADAVRALWEVVATCSANSAFDFYFRELSGASRDACDVEGICRAVRDLETLTVFDGIRY